MSKEQSESLFYPFNFNIENCYRKCIFTFCFEFFFDRIHFEKCECLNLFEEEFEDTKGIIRILKSKKNTQENGQKKKYKRSNNDLQNIHVKLKIE